MANSLELDFDEIKKYMLEVKPRKVLLQLPSGLKRRAAEIAAELNRRFGCDVIVSGDSCFGACDLPAGAVELVDAIIQVGHSPMPSIRYTKPVIFLPGKLSLDLHRLIDSAIPMLSSPVGLLATSQHIHLLDVAKSLLEKRGFKARIGANSRRLIAPGHVLGCDYSSALSIAPSVSSFLLLGGGRFHAIGIKLVTKKSIIVMDPERSTAISEEIDADAFLRKRFAVIEKLAEARSIAVILSSKIGQKRPELATELLEALKESGREGHLIVMDEISPERLDELGFDAYVSTACPRIALDDSERFGAPIGTPVELLIALSKIDWNDYQPDSWCTEKTVDRRDRIA